MNFPDFLQTFIDNMHSSLPGVVGAIVVFVVGWLIAIVIRKIVHGLMKKTEWDERLLGNTIVDTNKFVANLVYYLFMVILLLIVLEMLGLSHVLDPIKHMLTEFLGFIPNIVAAGAIVFLGYVIALFVSNLVKMAGSFIDRLAETTGFKDTEKLIYFLQKIVFVVIFIPSIIQALNALQLDAITNPANNILHALTDAVPNIIGAVLIVVIFGVGGKFLSSFLGELLGNMGADEFGKKLQLFIVSEDHSLSKTVANIVYFFIVFFGVVTGIEMLGFDRLSEIFHTILNLLGSILFGLLVMVIGNVVATTVHSGLLKANENSYLAGIARVGIIGLFLAIALRTMGIANSIVELAFGLTLGSLAVTIALAYGLGGREAAGKHMEKILKRFQKDEK
ncbi:MAG: mechanosensitive ion channel [Cyclobacteriaceae bacterium]